LRFKKFLNRKGAISCAFGDPAGIRTQDPYIKSVLLYQLSYGILLFFEVSFVVWSDAKVGFLVVNANYCQIKK
jgi:hypothetical protein